jgi:hypothetical protein
MSPHLRSVPPAHAAGSSPFFFALPDGSTVYNPDEPLSPYIETQPSMTTTISGPLHQERWARMQRQQREQRRHMEEDPLVRLVAIVTLVVCTFVPPLLVVYWAGFLDPLLDLVIGLRGERTGRGTRPHMPARLRWTALGVLIAEVLIVMVALTAWSVTRGGR